MAGSDFWQKVSASFPSQREPDFALGLEGSRRNRSASWLWIAADILTVLIAAAGTTMSKMHVGPIAVLENLWDSRLFGDRSIWVLLDLLFGFTVVLILISRRMHLYEPLRIASVLREQRLSAQACFSSGLLLTGTLYLVHGDEVPRSIVLFTLGLITIAVGLRRLVYRLLMYRRFELGVSTRNVLIMGTGSDAQALRNHLESLSHLGYTFKGFVDVSGEEYTNLQSNGVVGTLETLFQAVRKYFVDEILITTRCTRETIEAVLMQARVQGVDLRVVPDLYDGLAWRTPVEYVGQFPTLPLHCKRVPELGLMLKRLFDAVFSSVVLLMLLPVFSLIAVAIKLDSQGPVFYLSERIGKRGRVFRCIKFRTMIADADMRKAEILHMNERDDVLFKVANDPRITRLGKFLRKYSLDELPQFWNVLRGEMSVVGPRPPLGSEVREYNLSHLRRLDVMPGITGLWQVQGRQDPSFASYVSLDVNYIDNWSVWLDFKIIFRTLAVVFAGTGS
jgi:exopolysaccharide biosynthesis polyprenyl glycosylphosphotransferase